MDAPVLATVPNGTFMSERTDWTSETCGRGWTGLKRQVQNPECLKTWPQVRLDFSDLRARLDWALAHDREAHVMADAARRVAHRRLRYQDIQVHACRVYRYFSGLQGVRVATGL